MTCQISPFFTFQVLKIAAELEKIKSFFHCFRKHLFVLQSDGNSSQNYNVTAIYTLGTLNIHLTLFSMKYLASLIVEETESN